LLRTDGAGVRVFWLGLAAGVILVALVLLVARRSGPMFPVADEAVTELATLNAAHGRQLLGPYSRYPWHHPGPALFYLLAPFYEASGRRATGLSAGALAINVFSLALAVWVLWRRGGAALALMCAAAMALLLARVPAVLVSPWNPHVAAILAASVVILSASAAAGWPVALPVAAGLLSIVVQTHIATLPLAAVAIGTAAASLIAPGFAKSSRLLAATAVVLVAVWFVPFVEQVSPGGGNVGRLWRFAMTPSSGAGWPAAIRNWADALLSLLRPSFSVPVGVLVSPGSSAMTIAAAFGELLLLSAVALWARAHGRRIYAWMAVQLLATTLIALWAVSRIPDGVHDHEVFWIAVVGALNAGVILAWPLAATSLDEWRRSSAIVLALLVAGVATAGSVELVRMVDRSHALSFNDRLIRNLAGAVDAEIARVGSGNTLIKIDQRVWPAAAGVILQLRKTGRLLAVEPDLAHMFSGTLAADGSEDLEVSFCGGPCHEQLAGRPGNVVVWLGDGIAVDAVELHP
jgi:hypothetical protein